MEVGETILGGRMPEGMAACDSPPYLFVANPVTSDVTVLDTDTSKLVSAVRAGEEPHHVVFTPDHEYALVLNRQSGDLAVIHDPGGGEAGERGGGGGVRGAGFSPRRQVPPSPQKESW